MGDENSSDTSIDLESNAGTNDTSVSENDLGSSLLTSDEEQKESGVESNAKESNSPPDPSSIVPSKPEEYALNFSQDIQVDKALLENFKSTAHELGINQGQAQKLAELYAKHTSDSSQKAMNEQMAETIKAKQGWESEITSRPCFQQEVIDARRTLKEFGSPELNEIMDSTLLGSHPVFFDFIVKVGKALAEPEMRGGSMPNHKEKPLADRLWPGMK